MSTVICSDIPISTDDSKIREFFSFCGKVDTIEVISKTEKTKTVKVKFASQSAVSTATLLNGAELNGGTIHVNTENTSPSEKVAAEGDFASTDSSGSGIIPQEEKPKSTIAAEYLANGYVLSDNLIQKAVEFDNKHDISSRFKSFLQGIDNKYHFQAKGQKVNTKLGLDEKFNQGKKTLDDYLYKFKKGKYGSKLNDMYTNVATDVSQVHEQAKKIAREKEGRSNTEGTGPIINPTINSIGPESSTAKAAGAIAFEADKK
ncbi:actin cytoskeleton protein [Brettanomyces bruxellensis AWRI1499]|nr:actin cytoskeleton protein [Brettanomyces bruxellensis AWRI1499]